MMTANAPTISAAMLGTSEGLFEGCHKLGLRSVRFGTPCRAAKRTGKGAVTKNPGPLDEEPGLLALHMRNSTPYKNEIQAWD
jgi:hypothetical protein